MIRISALLLMISVTASAHAISIQRRDTLASICKKAPNIVHATVVDAELIPAKDKESLPTMCYRLGKVASLKGTVAEGVDAKLCYLGDVVSDTKMVVAGLRYPEVGEQGIFFVKEMNDMHAISPLQGWNQGHFSIKDEKPGGLIVASSTGRAICAGGMKGKVRNADPDSVQDLNLEEAGKACQKLTVSAFIKIIKSCGGDKP